MKPWLALIACAAAAIGLIGCCAGPIYADSDGSSKYGAIDKSVTSVKIKVLSSTTEFVSGGDVRIEVKAPRGLLDKLTFWLNGWMINPQMDRHGDRMEGVVSGLVNGENILEVRLMHGGGKGVSDSIRLTNYPITGPIFTGPQQQPFICRTEESGLDQPLVDNQEGIGHPIFEVVNGVKTSRIIGYSRTCSINTSVHYFYYTGSDFKPFDPATGFTNPPADLKTTTVHGVTIPFVVRVEVGTINRFLYTIATLAPFSKRYGGPDQFDPTAWNRKLLYWMRGGVGIGHQQGLAMWTNNNLSGSERRLMPRVLEQGYAVVASTGNETGTQYNVRLSEETALMTKEHFIEAYGKPNFTIGAGGSGGAIQQYLFAQNRPGLLDGGIPIQSFPDMITQTMPILDCPLLSQYFRDEVALNPASPWARWSNQRLIEGMNASDTVRNVLLNTIGSTECINGWATEVPTVLNPIYRDPQYDIVTRSYGYPESVFANVKWTHWNDLANIYGTNSQGYAPISYDNVGVQYGLSALTSRQIGTDEFLRINSCVGTWKEQPEFVQWDRAADPFDSRNVRRSATCREQGGTPAPRRKGDLFAIQRAYTSGHVFTGQRLSIPMIDARPYLEPVLNMHNSRQSFSVRARLLDANPHAAKNQVIWFTGSNENLLDLVTDALSVLDRYLSSGTAPAEFTDKCVDANGALIASGPTAWNGILNTNPPGACTVAYPIFTSPRMVAGESIKGDIFKCALKPVSQALADGTYGAVQFTAQERERLNRIFPTGVCDYSRGDQGRPASWIDRPSNFAIHNPTP